MLVDRVTKGMGLQNTPRNGFLAASRFLVFPFFTFHQSGIAGNCIVDVQVIAQTIAQDVIAQEAIAQTIAM